MKNYSYTLAILVLLSLSSCTVVNGIFKAGMIWGIFLVVGIIALIIYLISRGSK